MLVELFISYYFFVLFVARIGGAVVNTCGWVTGLGYKMLVHAAQAFDGKVIKFESLLSALVIS